MWEKRGECDMCGYCCEVVAHVVVDFTGNDPDWIVARGLTLTKELPLIDPCPQLGVQNKCRIYPMRPQQCQDFPLSHEQIKTFPCTYWFENTETGERKGGTRSPYPYT